MKAWVGSREKQVMKHPGTGSYPTLPWAVGGGGGVDKGNSFTGVQQGLLSKSCKQKKNKRKKKKKERPSPWQRPWIHVHSSGRKVLQLQPLRTLHMQPGLWTSLMVTISLLPGDFLEGFLLPHDTSPWSLIEWLQPEHHWAPRDLLYLLY